MKTDKAISIFGIVMVIGFALYFYVDCTENNRKMKEIERKHEQLIRDSILFSQIDSIFNKTSNDIDSLIDARNKQLDEVFNNFNNKIRK